MRRRRSQFPAKSYDRFARTHGEWRPVVGEVADKFLACGVLDHGFARIRCDGCTHEYLLAFSCNCRYFCPSCHAKRLALWGDWLETALLAPVPHRQVVLTIPKRLRAYCLPDGPRRREIGEVLPAPPPRSWRGVQRRAILPRPRLEFLSRYPGKAKRLIRPDPHIVFAYDVSNLENGQLAK